MNEDGLWRWMRDRLPPAPATFDRIESPITPGIPDVSYALTRRVEGWIELKATRQKRGYPFRADNCGLRASQILWIAARRRTGSRILIAAAMANDFAVWSSSIYRAFNDSSYDELHARALLWVSRRRCRLISEELLRGHV